MESTRLQADRKGMRRYLWLGYGAVGTAMLVAYLFVPGARLGPLFNVIGLSGAVAILLAVQVHRPEQRMPWILVAIGQTLFVAGDVITYNYERFFGTEPPFPSIGDALYLSVYPFLVMGIMLLIRRRNPGGDRASLIDSLIVAVGVGAMSWVFLIAPYIRDETLTLPQKLVAMGYPVMDLILFTAFVRLAVGAGRRHLAFYLITASVLTLFVTDSIYGWIVLHGTYDNTSGYLELGWGMFYVLWAAGALHPTMRSLDQPAPQRETAQPRRRLLLLASASLLSPCVLLVQAVRDAARPDEVAILAVCSITLFILVLVRLNGVMVDITEFRRTERQLQETDKKYRILVEGLPAIVYIADFGEDGPWRYISPQIEGILGFSRDEWMSGARVWRDHIVPEDRQRAVQAELQLLSGSGRMQCEYRIVARDGRVVWIREEAEPLTDADGAPSQLQGVMYDITEQKAAEEQLMRALETEKEASSRLRGLHEMQNSFLQAVSHDLRTPLTSILGMAITLENNKGELDPEDAKDLLRRLAANARKLHRLLTNLLDLDRMSRGIVEPNRALVDLNLLAATVIEETSTDEHRIELVTREPLPAYVDAGHVERIIENLVTNAVRYTPPGTPIWISNEEATGGFTITVEDAGPGVSAEMRAVIFEPFRQGTETLPHAPGVGIGLSLVARFAQLHGGRVWCEEREGGGARFRVFLRGADSPEATGAEARRTDGLPEFGSARPSYDEGRRVIGSPSPVADPLSRQAADAG
jgi:PAS domain S-box-containing protein